MENQFASGIQLFSGLLEAVFLFRLTTTSRLGKQMCWGCSAAKRAAGVGGAVHCSPELPLWLSKAQWQHPHHISKAGILNFTWEYFRRFLVSVKTSPCNIKANAGCFPDLLVQAAQADGANKALCYLAWPTCQPLSSYKCTWRGQT